MVAELRQELAINTAGAMLGRNLKGTRPGGLVQSLAPKYRQAPPDHASHYAYPAG